MVKFCLRDTAGSPERARWLHLARSGSQSQRAIWFILPAHGARHIIIAVIVFYSAAPQVYPWNVTGSNSSSTSIYLNWTAIPPELVAGVLTEYRVVYDELNDSKETVKTHILRLTIDQLSVNLTGLSKYTNYSFEVQGISKFFGVQSPPIVVITDQDGKACI